MIAFKQPSGLAFNLYLVLSCLNIASAADEPVESAFQVTKEASITARLSHCYQILADLGELPSSKKGSVHLQIANPTPYDFEVSEIRIGCACTATKLSESNIPSGGAVDFEFELTTPALIRSPSQILSLSFACANSQTREIQVLMTYRLKGMVAFRDPMSLVRVAQNYKTKTVDLPILVTDPVKAESLIVEPSKTLGATAAFVYIEKQPHIRVIFEEELAGSIRDGSLVIRDELTGRSDQCKLYLMSQSSLQVTPSIVRLIESASDDGVLEGQVLVRTLESSDESNEKQSTTSKMDADIRASINDIPVLLKITPLQRGVYRVGLSLKADGINSNKSEIRWDVYENGDLQTAKTTIALHRPITGRD